MLAEFTAMPVLAVTDLDRARHFYEDTLGFTSTGDVPEGVVYRAGDTSFLVYPSSYAGTNKATAVSFQVPTHRFDAEVTELRGRGVAFQTFELDGVEWTDGVADFGGTHAVWFADPDGNVLNAEEALA